MAVGNCRRCDGDCKYNDYDWFFNNINNIICIPLDNYNQNTSECNQYEGTHANLMHCLRLNNQNNSGIPDIGLRNGNIVIYIDCHKISNNPILFKTIRDKIRRRFNILGIPVWEIINILHREMLVQGNKRRLCQYTCASHRRYCGNLNLCVCCIIPNKGLFPSSTIFSRININNLLNYCYR
ncbi:hypothetical protein PYJP_06310 [Pyrofollis japonicus]|nr:hypothetical protein PYJP_06310 [Pyrofollis japonicus]